MKKKVLIAVIVVLVLALFGGGWLVWQKTKKPKETGATPTPTPEGIIVEVSLKERPFVSLTPSSDGHWLTINVSRIKEATTLEYELLYNTASGAMQGSINTVSLEGRTSYSKRILLGSESSGNYKYDQGVEEGSLTVKLRGLGGLRKSVSQFHLQRGEKLLTSLDGNFEFTATSLPSGYFVTMSTIGLPAAVEGEVLGQPYAVFPSGSSTIQGIVSLTPDGQQTGFDLYAWNGQTWQKTTGSVGQLGTFVAVVSKNGQ